MSSGPPMEYKGGVGTVVPSATTVNDVLAFTQVLPKRYSDALKGIVTDEALLFGEAAQVYNSATGIDKMFLEHTFGPGLQGVATMAAFNRDISLFDQMKETTKAVSEAYIKRKYKGAAISP